MGTPTYATSFALQWQEYRRVQLDSYTGHPISRERLERCLGASLESLRGKMVLEAGAGAGRFTELLVPVGARLVAADLTSAIVANYANCAALGCYLPIQADINALPLPERFFDVVLCLGVIQHTPWPEATIASLARHVTQGGWLVLDHYTHRSRLGAIGTYLSMQYPVRALLRLVARRNPQMALAATKAITAFCDPILRRTCRHRWLDSFVSRLLPAFCYYGVLPQVAPELVYQLNELDTHDGLTDWFKHFRSPAQIRATLERLGFQDIACWEGGNGVEARARRPGKRGARFPEPG